MKQGMVHIYTGDGKGKTTASLGLILRALGHNFKVCLITFHKYPEKYKYGEFKLLKKFKRLKIYNFAKICPYFCKKYDIEKIKKEILCCIDFIKNKIFSNYDLIVMDEVLVCVREKLLDIDVLLELIRLKPPNVELVLTGQSNTEIINKLEEYADYISLVKNLKHPYDKGIKRRKGIEY